jgi:MFS family permease
MPEPRVRLRLLEPLKLREFRTLWAGMTVSLVGDGITLVAVAWQVYLLSDAPSALAVVGIAMSVPHILLLLLGGVVSDRFDRRRVMIAADLVRGASVAALGVLSLSGALRPWHMVAIAACFGAGTAFFGPSFEAIVPEIVPAEQLGRANSLDQLIRPAAARLVGPAIGGWLIALFGPGGAFLADAATYAFSIACLMRMRSRPRSSGAARGSRSAVAEIREGFRFVRSRVWLWGTLGAATIAYLLFLGPSEVLLPYVVKNELGGSASDLGTVLALGGVGAVTASIVIGQRGLPRRHITFMYVAWTVSTLMIAGYGLASFTWQLMVACFVFNALETAGLIVWVTTKQMLVPSRLLGRVSSLDWFISIGLLPLSYALVGPVAGVIGARATLVGAGLLGALVTASALLLPGMRDVERVAPARLGERPAAVLPGSAA